MFECLILGVFHRKIAQKLYMLINIVPTNRLTKMFSALSASFFSFVYRKAIGLLFVFYMVNRRGYYHCTTGSPRTNCYISLVSMKIWPQKWSFELTVKIFGKNFIFSEIICLWYSLRSKLIYRILSAGWPNGTVPLY